MKINMILVASVLALSSMAQDTNEAGEASLQPDKDAVQRQTNRARPRREKKENPDKQQKKENLQQRRIQLMEKELNRIGVTEEEKAQITELQKAYKEKMDVSAQRIAVARRELSKLQNEGASMEVLEIAIQDISAAQAEQLRILVRNRMEMERILGKEKHTQFMQKARAQYQKHGRRGGPPLPPQPGLPPIPGQEKGRGKPPVPPSSPEMPPVPGK